MAGIIPNIESLKSSEEHSLKSTKRLGQMYKNIFFIKTAFWTIRLVSFKVKDSLFVGTKCLRSEIEMKAPFENLTCYWVQKLTRKLRPMRQTPRFWAYSKSEYLTVKNNYEACKQTSYSKDSYWSCILPLTKTSMHWG